MKPSGTLCFIVRDYVIICDSEVRVDYGVFNYNPVIEILKY